MKTQNFLLLICGIIILGLTSCKKNYTCKCMWAGGNTIGPTEGSETYANVTQDEAYNLCEAQEDGTNNSPQSMAEIGPCSCELE